ncbi:type I DNA topoisomerase [Helicobacter sp. MIT 05-5293]|uniref:type I DNA topoisomerase n=1 Tax=Helicobacter sp. MIT 05-5293 TaxID=1548149 RepID=UPI0010FCF1B2|nr:type I DNA topoisomerase [Helicobacter sp. MIT 05-5293]TLD80556.1 type I DNA topoisomerase [Helicobacter sp. MIT 05-5293]
MKDLIIVESPAKAKTIKNFLGNKYEVLASKGHIRDLPKYTLGIEIKDHSFIPQYAIDKDHSEIVSKIKSASQKAKVTYIATDEDREGEAIGFHITQAIGKSYEDFPRIVFHEITKSAIDEALQNPRLIDMSKVNAQQARRLLDRIVGFKLSQLISSKIQRGLSAGRVQSAALKIIVDREREILAFKPTIYFTITAAFGEHLIESELITYKKKLEKLSLQDSNQVQEILQDIQSQHFIIAQISKKNKKIPTPPPFMTSTLQQSASSQLGYSPSRTMSLAQRLYEGVETNNGIMGIITYMRTDSLNIAKEAQKAALQVIEKMYGKAYIPSKPKVYANKSKAAQEAHEAIRPTNLDFTPQIAQSYLKPDEYKLYKLIYYRFLASQSQDALFETQSILFSAPNSPHKIEFKANGRKLIFDGFYKIIENDDKDKLLPECKEGDEVAIQQLESHQKSTEAPARYSEASIIKTIETLGIGRPSTYAPTIALLVARDYIKIEKKQIIPQESAFKVTEMLEQHFDEIVDSHFSAALEDKLDEIAQQNAHWEEVLWDFYEPFMQKIEKGKSNIASQKVAIPTGEICPKCGKELVQRNGKYGEFIACSGYPKCKYIKPSPQSLESSSQEGVCEKCGKPMVKKFGRNGEFIACSGYPDCKNTKSLKVKEPKSVEGVVCPQCGGAIVQRFSKRGAFFGCSNYPRCNFISKFQPVNQKCPQCGEMMCERDYRKKHIYECPKCKYREEVETKD